MRTFTRVANMSLGLRDTGDEIDAAHINELQQAAEDLQAGALPIALAGIEGALGVYANERGVLYATGEVAWDGTTNDQAALTDLATEAVATECVLMLPVGTGLVTVFQPPSNLIMQGPGSAFCTVKQHSSATGANDSVIKLWDKERVTLRGFSIDGNRSAFSGVATEHKHGIDASGSQFLSLDDIWITNTKGDGMFVGVGQFGDCAEDLLAVNAHFHYAYRNNMSIIALDRANFYACSFRFAGGAAPEAGVDIEPDFNYEIVRDLYFYGCDCSDNNRDGWMASLKNDGPSGYQERIQVIGGRSSNNGRNGAYLYRSRAVSFQGFDLTDNAARGLSVEDGTHYDLTIRGGRIARNGTEGIGIRNAKLPNIQTITITGDPTGGSYTLTFDGQTTGAIAFNATRQQVKSALEALSNIATNDVILLGNRDNPVQLQLSGTWQGVAAPQITATPSLTGGTAPDVVVTVEHGSTRNVRIESVDILDNGANAPGTYDGVLLTTDDTGGAVDGAWIDKCKIGNEQTTNQYRGFQAAPRVTNGHYTNNDLRGNTGAPMALNDGPMTRVFRDNIGADVAINVTTTSTLVTHAETAVVNTSGGAITLTLPVAPVTDRVYRVYDNTGNAAANNITIAANTGHSIVNSSPCKITTAYGSKDLVFRGDKWFVVAEIPV